MITVSPLPAAGWTAPVEPEPAPAGDPPRRGGPTTAPTREQQFAADLERSEADVRRLEAEATLLAEERETLRRALEALIAKAESGVDLLERYGVSPLSLCCAVGDARDVLAKVRP